jgi:naphthoate synthase
MGAELPIILRLLRNTPLNSGQVVCHQRFDRLYRGGPISWVSYRIEMTYETILYEETGPVGRITLNRPDQGNMFNQVMLHELADVLEQARREVRTRVLVLTGAGDRFFCLGGDKAGLEDTLGYPGVLPIVDVYDLIDRHPKPIIASINGFAVGGGNVLHVVCDLTIAKESAVFRQVGPLVGSFDAGYGTWYLEDLVGRKRAKGIWFLNEKIDARSALNMGLVNRVVPDANLREETDRLALAIAERGSEALAAVKGSFNARSNGVAGFSRFAHDLLVTHYLETEEARELQSSFDEKRSANPASFWH